MGSLYGFEIKSEVPLRRLNSAAGSRGELTLERAAVPLAVPAGEPAGSLVGEDGYCWYASYELEGGECLLRLPPTGSFLLDPKRGRVVVEPTDDDAELLEHRIASSAVCTLLALQGDLVLHAAAVEAEGRAIVFCGPSLRGKSTLAAALGAAGCRLLAEDGVVVAQGAREPLAYPGARGVRMRRTSNDGATRTELLGDPGPGEPEPCPVGAIVLLGERRDAFAVESLEPVQALTQLTPNLVHSGGRGSIGAAFARLAALLGSVPALRASLPDDLASLPLAARELLDVAVIRG